MATVIARPVEVERVRPDRRTFARIEAPLDIPNLIQIQLTSFDWFKREGLRELFEEISPISDFTGKTMELRFKDYEFGEPRYSEIECRERDMTYAVPLRVKVELLIKETGEIKESEIFMGDFPMMTDDGTFVINGAERVVVSQLVRSPGVYFTPVKDPSTGRDLFSAKLIPNRGAWLEFETHNRDVLSVKVDRKRKIPVTILLRAIGYGTDEQLFDLFADVDTNPEHRYLQATIDREPTKTQGRGADRAVQAPAAGRSADAGQRPQPAGYAAVQPAPLRSGPGRPLQAGQVARASGRAGRAAPARADQGRPGRDRQEDGPPQQRRRARRDDIDHLGNRRIRAVGELIQNQFRIGLLRMERVVKERMTIQDAETVTPNALINIRPVVAAMREFFGGSQLSQFMDQTNPLSELTHKRRLSALGPGGLSRDRAGFEVRDVHHSHYGRICPIETPEGPNIGLIGTPGDLWPHQPVRLHRDALPRGSRHRVENVREQLIGMILKTDVVDPAHRQGGRRRRRASR